jgi:hypothetical protein
VYDCISHQIKSSTCWDIISEVKKKFCDHFWVFICSQNNCIHCKARFHFFIGRAKLETSLLSSWRKEGKICKTCSPIYINRAGTFITAFERFHSQKNFRFDLILILLSILQQRFLWSCRGHQKLKKQKHVQNKFALLAMTCGGNSIICVLGFLKGKHGEEHENNSEMEFNYLSTI